MASLLGIGRFMRQRLANDTMDPGTFFLLKQIQSGRSMRPTEVAACAGLDVSTVSRHLTQLHGQGLLERNPDPEDGRAQRVTLSALGADQLNHAASRRHALLGRTLEGWEAADVEHFDRLLGRFLSDLEQLNAELESR